MLPTDARMDRPADRPAGDPTERPPAVPKVLCAGVERTFDTSKRTVRALGPMDLEIAEHEFVCVVGPSGCGKSTLLRLIAGLIAPSRGRIELVHSDPAQSLLAVVFQERSLFPWRTVEQNVRYGLDIQRRVPRKERAARVHEWLRRMNIHDFAGAYPPTLSGGMQQRASIARAFVLEPEILLLDEPFASLDAQMRTILQDELCQLWDSQPRTAIFITHSIDEAIFLGDRVVVMSASPGTIRAEYKVPFERPRDHAIRATAEFGQLQEEIWQAVRAEVEAHLARGGATEA